MNPFPCRIFLYLLLTITGMGVFPLPDQVICKQAINQTPDSIPSETINLDLIPQRGTPPWVSAEDSLQWDRSLPVEDEGVDTTISYWAGDIDNPARRFDVESGITILTGHVRMTRTLQGRHKVKIMKTELDID